MNKKTASQWIKPLWKLFLTKQKPHRIRVSVSMWWNFNLNSQINQHRYKFRKSVWRLHLWVLSWNPTYLFWLCQLRFNCFRFVDVVFMCGTPLFSLINQSYYVSILFVKQIFIIRVTCLLNKLIALFFLEQDDWFCQSALQKLLRVLGACKQAF